MPTVSHIQLPADGAGKARLTYTTNVGSGPNTGERHFDPHSLVDADGNDLAVLTANPAVGSRGLVTRSIEARPPNTNVWARTVPATRRQNFNLAPANTSRLGLVITNATTDMLYVKFGATAAIDSWSIWLSASDAYEIIRPAYTGIVDAICDTTAGSVMVTEYIF